MQLGCCEIELAFITIFRNTSCYAQCNRLLRRKIMPFSKGEFKAQGLDEMRRHLLADHGRETRADLARRFNVDRATIGRWIVSLETMGYAVEEDEQRRLY